MFDSSGRKILLGVVTGTLLSVAITTALAANDRQTFHLLDTEGKPVLTQREGECVSTPNTPNDPTKMFKECGDIGDRDGDGVPDDEDLCPDNTPEEKAKGVYDNNQPPRSPNNKPTQRPCDKIGCPIDTDGDGVPDYRDDCPDTAAEYVVAPPECARNECVNERGCVADSDNDGIIDCKDACADTPPGVQVNEVGCSKDTPKCTNEVTLSNSTLFDFDKAILKAAGKIALDQIIEQIRGQGDNFNTMYVIGHTDPVGSDKYNLGLSKERAKAVADYLMANGVSRNKLMQEGKGESELLPREPGESTSNWHARCRRVVVTYTLYKNAEGEACPNQ